MIDPAHSLPLTKQAAALGISRSSVYYLPRPVSERDEVLMNRLDRLHRTIPLPVPVCSGICSIRQVSTWVASTWVR